MWYCGIATFYARVGLQISHRELVLHEGLIYLVTKFSHTDAQLAD